MTLVISMLNNIFLCILTVKLASQVPQCATLIVTIQIFFHLNKLRMVRKSIQLAISRCDALRPLGIQFRPFTNSVHDTKDTLTSVISPSVMSLPLLYHETLGDGCAQLKSPSLLSQLKSLLHVVGFNIKTNHQRIQTTRLHASCCRYCHYCTVDFV